MDTKILRKKQRLFAWACKSSNEVITSKINELLDVILKNSDTEEVEEAKFSATELANILGKRTKAP